MPAPTTTTSTSGPVGVTHYFYTLRAMSQGPVPTYQLEGLRILDLTVWRPGPYATQLLAEQGADVLKVEPPGGDPMRSMPDLFDILGAGKRSIVLDLKDDADRATCLDLAAGADVLVESYRPGVADRLGVGYEAIAAVNPAIVYCSISGFGALGPLSSQPGHDVNYLAYSGTLRPSGGETRHPTVPISDLAGGLAGAFAIATACLGARARGQGERIDVSVADVLATWVGPVGEVRMIDVEKPLAGLPGYGTFPTADGGEVALGIMNEDHFWIGLCRALDLHHHETLDRTERTRRKQEVNRDIAKVIGGLTQDEALARLLGHDVPASPVLTRAEMLEHPHFRERGTVVTGPDGRPASGPIVRFETSPGRPPYGAPAVGSGEARWLASR
jgi:crotonobetainyl-CoA:carnitine CoA-transferase CaiB-like acyl-CoA transferase